ncbi:MAG: glycosyltransferase [Segetibacter sp.]
MNIKEVWVIDGNSSDKTCEIVGYYANQFPFIHYLSEKDNGIYYAMNKGISRSKGDWLYFLGSDDRLVNNEILSKIFTNQRFVNNNVIYGKVNSNRWNGNYGKKFEIETFYQENICHQAIF